MKNYRITVIALFALLASAGSAASQEANEQELPSWAVGFRLGNERQQGKVDDYYHSELFPGIDVSLYGEFTLEKHVYLGLEAGAADSTAGGGQQFEHDFTRLYYGPYLRLTLFPGHFSPYFLGSVGVHHAFAGNYFLVSQPGRAIPLPLDQRSGGFTWSAGGGIELPVVDDFAIAAEARWREYTLSDRPNARVIEILIAPRLWIR